MSYRDKMVEYLTQPDNFSLGLEISDYIQEVINQMHRDFWERMNQALESILGSHPLKVKWEFKPASVQDFQRTENGCYFVMMPEKGHPKYPLEFYFGQWSRQTKFRLFHGLHWAVKPASKLDTPHYLQLVSSSRNLQMTIQENDWPAYRWLNYWLGQNQFLVRYNQEPELVIQEISQLHWNTFLGLVDLIEAANKELAA